MSGQWSVGSKLFRRERAATGTNAARLSVGRGNRHLPEPVIHQRLSE